MSGFTQITVVRMRSGEEVRTVHGRVAISMTTWLLVTWALEYAAPDTLRARIDYNHERMFWEDEARLAVEFIPSVYG